MNSQQQPSFYFLLLLLFATTLLFQFISTQTAPPSNWFCNSAWYNDGTTCHCACGAWDPDCDITVPITNYTSRTLASTPLNCPCFQMSCQLHNTTGYCQGSCSASESHVLQYTRIIAVVNSILLGLALLIIAALIIIRYSDNGNQIQFNPAVVKNADNTEETNALLDNTQANIEKQTFWNRLRQRVLRR